MAITYRGESFAGYNKPKRTPGHKTKSHAVLAKDKARKRSYYARHNAQDSNPDKLSARYWSHKVKW